MSARYVARHLEGEDVVRVLETIGDTPVWAVFDLKSEGAAHTILAVTLSMDLEPAEEIAARMNGPYPTEQMSRADTYLVRRFYFDEAHPDHRKVIRRGLTLQEAQAHCLREDTSVKDANGHVVWYDGYDKERSGT